MVVLPLKVLHGAVQNKSFDYFYGPLSLWLPAAVYQVLGVSLTVERAIGALYGAVAAYALYFLGRRWSNVVGLGMALLSVVIISGFAALPLPGSIGCCLWAIFVMTRTVGSRRGSLLAGALLACSIDLRPDFGLWASLLLCVILALAADRACRPYLLAGFLVGLLPYVVLVATAGLGNVFRGLVVDALHVGGERHLPLPPWTSPDGRVFALLLLILLVGSVVAIRAVYRPGRSGRQNSLALALLLSLSLVPEFLQRPEHFHLAAPAFVLISLAPAIAAEAMLTGRSQPKHSHRPSPSFLPTLAVGGLLWALSPSFAVVPLANTLREAGRGGDGLPVANRGRVWYYQTRQDANQVHAIINAVDRSVPAGRDLFVGTQDLSQTPYTHNDFYYLLPQFAEHDHFYDFHPRIALVYGKRLASDVQAADVLVLDNITSDEPNLSRLHAGQ